MSQPPPWSAPDPARVKTIQPRTDLSADAEALPQPPITRVAQFLAALLFALVVVAMVSRLL